MSISRVPVKLFEMKRHGGSTAVLIGFLPAELWPLRSMVISILGPAVNLCPQTGLEFAQMKVGKLAVVAAKLSKQRSQRNVGPHGARRPHDELLVRGSHTVPFKECLLIHIRR